MTIIDNHNKFLYILQTYTFNFSYLLTHKNDLLLVIVAGIGMNKEEVVNLKVIQQVSDCKTKAKKIFPELHKIPAN